MRSAIRDAVNRRSRNPFFWGGLQGYEQLQAIADVLNEIPEDEPETAYLRRLAKQVDRVLDKNRALARDLRTAHEWIRRIADCLRYPTPSADDAVVTAQQVKEEMEALLQAFHPTSNDALRSEGSITPGIVPGTPTETISWFAMTFPACPKTTSDSKLCLDDCARTSAASAVALRRAS